MRDVFRTSVVFFALLLGMLVPARASTAEGIQMTMQEALFDDLMRWAVKLSGLPGTPHMPTIHPISSEKIVKKVCPEDPINCRSLVSFYSTDEETIFYLDSLDLDDDTDLSFIVHELVHHLQYAVQGDQLFSTCSNVMMAESQAYAVQNKYLTQFKQWRRVGEAMRFINCDALDDSRLHSRPPVN